MANLLNPVLNRLDEKLAAFRVKPVTFDIGLQFVPEEEELPLFPAFTAIGRSV